MDLNKFTLKAQEAIEHAGQLTQSLNNQSINTGHLLKAILNTDEDVTNYILGKFNVNRINFQKALDQILKSYPKVEGGSIYLSSELQKILNNCINDLKILGDSFVSIELLLLGLTNASDSIGALLKDNGIKKDQFIKVIKDLRKGSSVTSTSQESNYQALEKYAKNLNEMAKTGKLDPVIGRDDEIRRVLQILSRRTKTTPF